MQGVSNNTHQRTTHHIEQGGRPGGVCCRLTRGRWCWLWAVVWGRQHICRCNKSEHCRCTHRIPGVLLCPPAYVCRLLGRCLHICHGALHGSFGVGCLLGEKYTLLI